MREVTRSESANLAASDVSMRSRTRPSDATRTLLHISSFNFGRRHHPATWRQIVGLAGNFRTVVLSGELVGYFPDGHPDDTRDAERRGIQIHSFRDRLVTLREPAVASLAETLTVRHGRIDAILGHLRCGALGIHLARRLSVPIIATFHGDDANFDLTGENFGKDYALLRSAPATRFLAVSRNLADRLLEFGTPPDHTFVHRLGIDLDEFAITNRNQTGHAPRIVMVGSFRPSKGHSIAIRAFAKVLRSFPGASLHLIGRGEKPAEVQHWNKMIEFSKGLVPSGSVKFYGSVPVDELPRYLAEMDIAIQPSVFLAQEKQIEGIPNAILEAMAMELPVIATRHGGIPEIVEHEKNGLLVQEHDPDGLAEALARLASGARLRERYGRRGRMRIEAEFDWTRQNEQLAGHVRQAIDEWKVLGPSAGKGDGSAY